MTDNITLRRAAEYARVALDRLLYCEKSCNCFGRDAITALDAALAEPPAKPDAKPEPVAWMYVNSEGECEQIEYETPPAGDDSITPLYAAPPEPPAKPEPVHPGYVIGSHWLETAYSRIAAGESEAEVLTEVLGARGWVKPEPATDEQVVEAYGVRGFDDWWSDYQAAWREAERFHGIRGSKT